MSEDVSATAFKLRDDIDMDAVQAEFADGGYEESDVDGYPAYSLDISDLSVDEYPIPSLLNVIVIPDEQLLLTGPHAEVLIGPATDDADSLADSDLADDLVGEVENPEYLQLSLGDSSCVDAMEALVRTARPSRRRSSPAPSPRRQATRICSRSPDTSRASRSRTASRSPRPRRPMTTTTPPPPISIRERSSSLRARPS